MRCAMVVLAALLTACFHAQYVTQAAFGQLELAGRARPVAEVIADPDTDERTRALLAEVGAVTAFARRHGLDTGGSYRDYVELERGQVVWFITASRPLAFEPKLWWFPIVGSFPYLGWFDGRDVVAMRDALARAGWDVYVRPVRAYSTAGWFDDPVLSTMFLPGDDAVRYLANVLIHELVHANVLVAGQSTFNESVASFVGDGMADDYLVGRFGAGSEQVTSYREEIAEDRRIGARMAAAYGELDRVYGSDASDADKLAAKQRVLAALDAEIITRWAPNNAMLLGYKTYNAGQPELEALFDACDRDWPRFLATVGGLPGEAFGEEQNEDFGPVIAKLECVAPGAVSSGAPRSGSADRAPLRPRAAPPALVHLVRDSRTAALPGAP